MPVNTSNRLSRRNFLKAAAIFSVSASSISCTENVFSAQPKSKSNVLFIAIDSLWDWVGYMKNYSGAKTPNLDRLAEKGIAFNNAHVAGASCAPSRTALLTGFYPWSTGVYEQFQAWPDWLMKAETLTQAFMKTGYYVAGAGLIYHGGDAPGRNWHDYFDSVPQGNDALAAMPRERRPGLLGNPLDCEDHQTPDGKRVSWAINKLEEKHSKPLFLACGIVQPHPNWNVPRKYFDMHPLDSIELPKVIENDLDDVPPLAKKMAHLSLGVKKENGRIISYYLEDTRYHPKIVENKNWRKNVQAVLAAMTFADAQVGKLLDAWYASPYSNNGIIVLWSDHSQHVGQKEHWGTMTLWEETTHVPFIVVAPGVTKPGSVCNRPVSLVDIYPTLIELCGLNKNPDLDGKSLVPLMHNPKAELDRPAVITSLASSNYAVRSENWRYIRYSDGSEELYDHQNDPYEWYNLAGKPEYKDSIKKHRRYIPKCRAKEGKFTQKSFMESLEIFCR